ncbi:MAG: DUF547 domain-containing protein [Candidatus Dadabacteria bacterium]|nr:MAG: DUF547 domain-containing protein [Candidatus Dadabacteria bacterium]
MLNCKGLKRFAALVLFFLLTAPKTAFASFDHSHQDWDHVLKKYVHMLGPQSRVDYSGLKSERHLLDSYIGSITAVSKTEYQSFSRDQKLAFLINAYNALTVKLIVDNYPVSSIKDLGSWLRSPWKKKFFKLFGEWHTLDDIEHGIIRKNFNEPRIHFALVCAARSCPALRNEAYRADRLSEQLEDAARKFLRDKSRNRYLPAERRLELSSIFKWYRSDFEKNGSTLKLFIALHMTDDPVLRREIQSPATDITFLDYDWSLNDFKR